MGCALYFHWCLFYFVWRNDYRLVHDRYGYLHPSFTLDIDIDMIPVFLQNAEVNPRLDDLHRDCIAQSKPGGLFLEFGVCEGTSLTMLRSIVPQEQKLYGFDSFEGLPEDWNDCPAGTFKTKTRVELENVELVVGWFDNTVPAFAKAHAGEHISYMHIDCDLYSSTKTVLKGLNSLIVPGTVIVFDELFGYESWEQHEFKAFSEFVQETNRKYEIIARHTYYSVGIKIIEGKSHVSQSNSSQSRERR
jgi:predicted O-methyltransferase YrrM